MLGSLPKTIRRPAWRAALLLIVAALLSACGDDPQIDAQRQTNDQLAQKIEALSTQVAELSITPTAAAAPSRTSAPTLPLIPTPTPAPNSAPTLPLIPTPTPAPNSAPTLPLIPTPTPTPAPNSAPPSTPIPTATAAAAPTSTALATPPPTSARSSSAARLPGVRWTNPTAPNELTKYLLVDLTDSDGDGMTDLAERKYRFDPLDPFSFPAEPEPTTGASPEKHPIEGSDVGAYYEIGAGRIDIKWEDPGDGKYLTHVLSLKTEGSDEWNIYYGGHDYEYAPVVLRQFQLAGTETLVGKFSRQVLDRTWVGDFSEFTIDLSTLEFPGPSIVGDPSNRISYTFSRGFPKEAQEQYRRFLKRVFPILYEYLGPPAETFNILISDLGEDGGTFLSTDDGRVLVTDASFLPRLIVHQLVHSWEGSYGIASDENWQYDDSLSGFAEGLADGMAYEIIHEYVRSYPNDASTLQVLDDRLFQYWSLSATHYDAVKSSRWTGAGDFWTHTGGIDVRYSIAATTVQMMVRENPSFMKEFMSLYYRKVTDDPGWRPNREDLVGLWETLVPELNGYPLGEYLDTLPVFNGRRLDEGIYVLDSIRPYGKTGDQWFGLGYAIPDGSLWWGISKDQLADVPEWVRTTPSQDGYHYIDTQGSSFIVDVTDAYGREHGSYSFKTAWDRELDGSPTGLGWTRARDLDMRNFPIGLYRVTVTFTDHIDHDAGAREDYYFFGLENFDQDRDEDYVIMIGVDGVPEGTAQITIDGDSHTTWFRNGSAIFRLRGWPFDMRGLFSMTITNPDSVSRTYYRTLIEAATADGYFQHQFIIVDTDFDGIEDQFE